MTKTTIPRVYTSASLHIQVNYQNI